MTDPAASQPRLSEQEIAVQRELIAQAARNQLYVASFQMGVLSNEIILWFGTNVGVMTPNGDISVATQPAATVVMSPQSAKELSVILSDNIAQYEAEFGVIDTAWLRERRGK